MKTIHLFFCMLAISGFIAAQEIVIDGVPRDTSYNLHDTYIKQKKYHPFIEEVDATLPSGVKVSENIVYSKPNEGRELLLNVYRPDNNKRYPALLMVHGGGWSSGTLSLQIPMAQKIAAEGFVTIPVEYRLSPEAKYPAGVYDLKTAVRWIRANADKYRIDTEHIAISGCSAGGQLATLIGTTNFQEAYEDKREYANFPSNVNAVINIDGTSDFTVQTALDDIKASIAKKKLPASVKWFGGTYDVKKELWIGASSVYHVTKNSAPICFINSDVPRFHDGRDEISAKLKTYNIYTEVHTFEKSPHTFWLFHPWYKPTVDYTVAFMKLMFK